MIKYLFIESLKKFRDNLNKNFNRNFHNKMHIHDNMQHFIYSIKWCLKTKF